jgi:hypothetical protein
MCAQCGLDNIVERETCKRCHTPLPPPTRHYERQPVYQPTVHKMDVPRPILWLIVAGILALIIYNAVEPPTPSIAPFSLESTISRANREIAIDDPEHPSYRWVFTSPEDYTMAGSTGMHAEHQPAQVIYTNAWSQPVSRPSTHQGIDLSEEEWQQVQSWKQRWCRAVPDSRQAGPESSIYTIAMRCSGYEATLFRSPKITIPVEIARMLQRAAQ